MSFPALGFTTKGRALMAKALSGTTLNFTRIKMGSGTITNQTVAALTDLITPEVSLNITKATRTDTFYTVRGAFSNEALATGFYWREIGVFATDPDEGEILYAYSNNASGAEYISAAGSTLVEKMISVPIIVGNASTVTATIDSGLVYITPSELASAISAHSVDTGAHSGKANKIAAPVTGNIITQTADGDLADSGKKISDFGSAADVAKKANKITSPTTGNIIAQTADGDLADSGKKVSDFATSSDVAGKISKVSDGIAGNFAFLTDDGSISDNGLSYYSLMSMMSMNYEKRTFVGSISDAAPAIGNLWVPYYSIEIRCTNPSLTAAPTFTIPEISAPDVKHVAVVIYKSPNTTAPVITNNSGYTLKYFGADVENGTFTPVSGVVYHLKIFCDGIYMLIQVDVVDGSSFLLKRGGTMEGILVAQNNASYTTKQVRNVTISTSSPSGGSNGDIWHKYTV